MLNYTPEFLVAGERRDDVILAFSDIGSSYRGHLGERCPSLLDEKGQRCFECEGNSKVIQPAQRTVMAQQRGGMSMFGVEPEVVKAKKKVSRDNFRSRLKDGH